MSTYRIYFDAEESVHRPFFIDFEFADHLPVVGESYNGKKVTGREEIPVDKAQANKETVRLVFFRLSLENEETEPEICYVCIDADARTRQDIVFSLGWLVPSVLEANILLARNLHKSPYLAEELYGIDGNELIWEYWGISDQEFEDLIAKAVRDGFAKWQKDTPQGSACIEFTESYINFYADVPYSYDHSQALVLSGTEEIDEAVSEGVFPPRFMKDLNPKIFGHIVDICEEQGGDWLAYEGYPAWMGAISLNPREVLEICDRITTVCCAPPRKLMEECGLTPAEFARRFHIGKSTVDSWIYEKKPFKIYNRLMFGEAMGLIERRK